MSWTTAVAASVLPNIGGWIGGIITRSEVRSKDGSIPWYETLKRPSWRPPNWAFGPVWTALYTGMGYASYLVWRDGNGLAGDAKIPLMLYGTQLAMNWAWTPIFFGLHKIKWSLVDIVVQYGFVVACGLNFYEINTTAGLLFVPYVLWMTLATCINYCIWRDNPEGGPKIKERKE